MVLVSLKDLKYIVGNHSPKLKDNPKGQQSKKLPVGPRPCTRSLTKELELVGGEEEGAVLPLLDVDEERLRQQRESTPTGNVDLRRQRRGPRRELAGRPPGRPRTRGRRPENYVENMESIVRETVSQVLASINSSNVGTSHERSAPSGQISQRSSRNNGRDVISSHKIADILQKWGVRFDGSTEGLSVEEFLYRLNILTQENLGSDFELLNKNIHQLLMGKASSWYWRFHKQVQTFTWSEFCEALREQYRESRSTTELREQIRARKQKPGESFDSFYEAVCKLIDKLSVTFGEDELVEMIQGNLLTEMKDRLLFEKVSSISELRQLVQKRENFLKDLGKPRMVPQKGKDSANFRVYALDETPEEEIDNSESDLSIAAVNHTGSAKITCWNCEMPGHVWEDCLAEKRVFCYGCGAPQIYKPNCANCKRKSENRLAGTFNQNRVSHK